jgi:hypothetical protein
MIKIVSVAVFVLALIVLGPLLTIWSMNTLFPTLAIPYTWETWAAVVVIGGLFKSNVTVNKHG